MLSFLKPNVGMLDKMIRYAVGVILISMNLSGWTSGILGTIAVMAGLVILLTGLLRFCPIYRVLGINTWKGEMKETRKE